MRKTAIMLTVILCIMANSPPPAFAFDVSPSLDSHTSRTSYLLSPVERGVVDEVKKAMADRIARLEELEKNYPNTGFGGMASSMRTRLDAINSAVIEKGDST